MEADKPWYVYILLTAIDTLYIGISTDVEDRVSKHSRGRGAKYLRGKLPVRLLAILPPMCRGEALRKEYELKQLSRKDKLSVVAQYSVCL